MLCNWYIVFDNIFIRVTNPIKRKFFYKSLCFVNNYNFISYIYVLSCILFIYSYLHILISHQIEKDILQLHISHINNQLAIIYKYGRICNGSSCRLTDQYYFSLYFAFFTKRQFINNTLLEK